MLIVVLATAVCPQLRSWCLLAAVAPCPSVCSCRLDKRNYQQIQRTALDHYILICRSCWHSLLWTARQYLPHRPTVTVWLLPPRAPTPTNSLAVGTTLHQHEIMAVCFTRHTTCQPCRMALLATQLADQHQAAVERPTFLLTL